MAGESVISVRHLKTYFYTEKRCNKAVNDVSFEIRKGKCLCVVGESGCGKSVTASSIMQLLPRLSRIEEGEIIYHTHDKGDVVLSDLGKNSKEMRAYRGKNIAMIFQDPMTALNPVFKVGNQIAENIRQHDKCSKAEARKRTLELLKQMGIPEPERRIDQYPHEYSGGMRQRAMIALAMSCSPDVLLADEPTTALDVTIQAQIFELMTKLKEENDTAILLITHDMGVVCEMADDVLVMYMGNVVESGTAREVLKNPKHPYTRALLASILVLGKGKDQNIQPIRGMTPNPYNRPPGCQFEPRCDFACEACRERMPDEEVIEGTTHMIRCCNWREACKNDGE
ncbi:MAG: ABC transporter ATP-binding protein [Firmicutes bacterium]|nr:ABC transporter ATP-binding protein [Lachnospiraceae bacterium]MBQ1390733.1 ABC transporter ATP-binding protein [Bacillota bacterium]